jgi:hypothetical protein
MCRRRKLRPWPILNPIFRSTSGRRMTLSIGLEEKGDTEDLAVGHRACPLVESLRIRGLLLSHSRATVGLRSISLPIPRMDAPLPLRTASFTMTRDQARCVGDLRRALAAARGGFIVSSPQDSCDHGISLWRNSLFGARFNARGHHTCCKSALTPCRHSSVKKCSPR